jgi:enolase
MDVQDFLAVPVAARSIEEAIRHVAQVRASAATLMAQRGLPTLLADEGGLSPGFRTGRKALQFMVEAFEHAGFRPGLDMGIAIDVAASTLHAPDGRYDLAREGRVATAQEMIALFDEWVRDFPICSIEDGLDEEAWSDWQTLTEQLGSRVLLVGDDLFTTNAARLEKGIAARIGNGVLVKLNQNGTLTGTLDVIARARRAGYAAIVSARSGETEDPFIADLAVGCATGHIKIGSVRCSDRLAKYNQLVRIEEQTGAPFAGMSRYRAWQGNAS